MLSYVFLFLFFFYCSLNAKSFVTQCRPQSLYDLVKKLNDRQKEDIHSIGFGGLLQLCTPVVPVELLKEFVKRFNGINRMLTINDKHSFVVTVDDVFDVFLLPRVEGKSVLECQRKEYNCLEIVKRWSKEYDIDCNTSMKALKAVLLTLVDGGDDFKRLFVLFSLSSFLCPSTNRLINFKTVKAVSNVVEISKFDWCSYVLKCLCKAVIKFNSAGLVKNCSGCVFILPILYFHRMKWQGIAEPSKPPLLQYWSEAKLRKRFKEEMMGGGFGNGVWVNDMYPIHKATVDRTPDIGATFECKRKENCEDNDDLLTYIKYQIPEDQPHDDKLKMIAKDDVSFFFFFLMY